jgi:predicted membrane protein
MRKNNSILFGLVLIALGVLGFLHVLGYNLPRELFKPYTILLIIGLVLGSRKNFGAPYGWVAPIIIAMLLFVHKEFNIDMWRFVFPVGLIGVGLYTILKPKIGSNKFNSFSNTNPNNNTGATFNNSTDSGYTSYDDVTAPNDNPFAQTSGEKKTDSQNSNNETIDNEEFVKATSIFSGVKKIVRTNNFKGGDVVAVFGGVEINLLSAEMPSPAIIDINIAFAGTKLLVPNNWEVKNEITAIFGGIEDRRPVLNNLAEPKKILILKGMALMGGVEIRSF